MQASKDVLKRRRLSITDHVRWSSRQVEKGDNGNRRLVDERWYKQAIHATGGSARHVQLWRRDSDRIASERSGSGTARFWELLIWCAYTKLVYASLASRLARTVTRHCRPGPTFPC